jgi:hypothetical protein
LLAEFDLELGRPAASPSLLRRNEQHCRQVRSAKRPGSPAPLFATGCTGNVPSEPMFRDSVVRAFPASRTVALSSDR